MNKRSKKAKTKILNSFVSHEEINKVIKAMENHMKDNRDEELEEKTLNK